MKKVLLLVVGWWLIGDSAFGQSISQRLQKAFGQFEADSQLRHAISSLYVIDANTGEVVFDKNSQIGLAPASTQKIITSVTAFELLGKDYRYETEFRYHGAIRDNKINGNLIIYGSGDPTFGSWRWQSTKDTAIFTELFKVFKERKFKDVNGDLYIDNTKFNSQGIPDRWIWQDIGNYYGAGAYALNWRENQYDVILRSGDKVGEEVKIVDSDGLGKLNTVDLRAAAKGTGDNAYIYYNKKISGTIPIGEKSFKISGATIEPEHAFKLDFMVFFHKKIELHRTDDFSNEEADNKEIKIYTHYSPPLDSIIYWFNKKSINLYGEALVKTFAYEKQGFGSTDSGVAILRKFWKEKGYDEEELNIYDGSGLSPMNRVTTHIQVELLKYAKSRQWFSSFYYALPEYNGMKMKSGTIGDVKAFCGYQKSKDGKEYIFSFIVNNYNGRTSPVVNKMYKVLDELKQ